MLVVVLLGTALLAVLFLNATGGRGAIQGIVSVRHAGEIEAPPVSRTMIASYYGPGLWGNPTASEEPLDPQWYTAVHNSLPLGTELRVSYGDESVQVTVNYRGPYASSHDLSLAAAREINFLGPGTAPVRVVVL